MIFKENQKVHNSIGFVQLCLSSIDKEMLEQLFVMQNWEGNAENSQFAGILVGIWTWT